MQNYIYNVQYTIEVHAENEDEAYTLLLEDDENACVTTDSDIQFVGVEPIEE